MQISRIRWFVIAALLLLAVHPLFAQDSAEPLTQSEHVTDSGLTLAVSFPAGWQGATGTQQVLMASDASSLQDFQKDGVVKTADATGIQVVMPGYLTQLKLPSNVAPGQLLNDFMQTAQAKGTAAQASSDFAVPAAVSALSIPALNAQVVVGAFQFPAGDVLFIISTGGSQLNETLVAILNSITLTGGGVTSLLQSTEASTESVSQTPTVLTLNTLIGNYQLSMNLPPGWVAQDPQNGTVNFANSPDSLTKMTHGDELAAGEAGMLLFLPLTVRNLGITSGSTPQDAVKSTKDNLKVTGDIQTDSSFSVPMAYAHVTGSNVPQGGGAIYALKFDSGMLIFIVQPDSSVDAGLVAALKSTQYVPVAGTPEATEAVAVTAEATEAVAAVPVGQIAQWASSADGSSEYSDSDWDFNQATGKPDTPSCGDNGTAWASLNNNTRDYLRVTFAKPVIPSQINIYQSFTTGAIVGVDLGNSTNPNQVLSVPNSADPPGNTPCPGVFSVNVTGVTTPIDFVVIYVDQTITNNWDEIDAVQLVGTPAS